MNEITAKYSNYYEVSGTIAEIRVLFGIETPNQTNMGIVRDSALEPVADIRLSHVVAKQLYESLGDVIGHYERAFGEIITDNKSGAENG